MPLIYKFLTSILAFTGCAGLLITGELNPIMLISGAALFPGYIRFLKDMSPLSRWTIGGLSIAALFLFAFDALIVSVDVFMAVAHLTIVFQAIKSFDLKEPWDHLQVYFMALLQLIIASELTRSAAFGIVFIIFLIALVTAMVISHFLKEGIIARIRFRGPVIAVSILTLVLTGIFFVSAPRAKGGFFGKSRAKGIKTVGFSEKVDFGSYGEVKLDPTVIMRVEMPDSRVPLYWRGMTLDYFDGVSWRDTVKKRGRIMRKEGAMFVVMPFSPEKALVQKVFLEPLDSEVIFGLGTIAGVEIESRTIFYDYAGAVYTPEKSVRRLNYTVYSILEEPALEHNPDHYLQTPDKTGRIKELAYNITRGAGSNPEKASRIEGFLKNNFRYTLETTPPPPGTSAVEYFLFDSKEGYCEHYATAMALLLRNIGIHSRIVTGFIGGEKNKYGGYVIVRQSDAHSWVEALIDGRWKRFDPTPPAPAPAPHSTASLYLDSLRMKWYRYIVNFTSADQRKILEFMTTPFIRIPDMPEIKTVGLRKLFGAAGAVAVIAAFVFFFRQLRIKRHGFITRNYLKIRRVIKRRGGNITESSTPSDVLKEALRLGYGGDLPEFIKTYELARFGGMEISAEEKMRYKSLAGKLSGKR